MSLPLPTEPRRWHARNPPTGQPHQACPRDQDRLRRVHKVVEGNLQAKYDKRPPHPLRLTASGPVRVSGRGIAAPMHRPARTSTGVPNGGGNRPFSPRSTCRYTAPTSTPKLRVVYAQYTPCHSKPKNSWLRAVRWTWKYPLTSSTLYPYYPLSTRAGSMCN